MKNKIYLLWLWALSLGSLLSASEVLSMLEFNQVNMRVSEARPGDWKYTGPGQFSVQEGQAPDGSVVLAMGEGQLVHATLFQERSSSRRYAPNGISDRFYTVQAKVAGQGAVRLGVRDLSAPSHGVRSVHWGEWVQLNEDWTEVTLSGQVQSPFVMRQELVLEAQPTSEVRVYGVEFFYQQTDEEVLDVRPRSVFARAGGTVSFELSTSGASEVTVRRYDDVNGANRVEEFTVEPGRWDWDIPREASGSFRMTVSLPEQGQSHQVFVQVLPAEVEAELDRIAAEITLPAAVHLLVIGDSLTDFHRGYNYLNIVDYFINKYNPGQFSFRNIAVGGDYVHRVWHRFQHLEGARAQAALRQEMYQDFLEPLPDEVWIFLGANDTKASSRHDYAVPLVTPDKQQAAYRDLLTYLREKGIAQVALIGCPSFNSQLCRANALRRAEQGRTVNMFGIDEHIIGFNTVLQGLSAEYAADYIDLFTRTVEDPNKNDWYYPTDGVHLTDQGHQEVALEMLRYLRDRQQ